MEEQGIVGDQIPPYPQLYDDNLESFLSGDFNLQQHHEIASFNGASNHNNNINLQQQHEIAPFFNIASNYDNNINLQQNEIAPFNGNLQQQEIGRQEMIRQDLQRRFQMLQQTHFQMLQQREQLFQQMLQQREIHQREQLFQQMLQQREIHQMLHPPSMEMQFQQLQHVEQSKTANTNVVSQPQLPTIEVEQCKTENKNVISLSMETAPRTSPPEAEKRKRGRPRKTANPADIQGSILPLGSFKGLQFEYGEPALFRIIVIAPGEDVYEKIMSFCQQTPLTVCIMSAKGTISNVDFLEIGSRRITNYKGEFEIISLSRCYRHDSNGLRLTLVHPDGEIFLGMVEGPLTAASSVEVVVGVFSSSPVYIPGQVGDKGPQADNI